MSGPNDSITHPGTITRIGENTVFVKILAQSACATCHSKAMCSVADMEEKIIEVDKAEDENYKIDDTVTIAMEKSMGTRAVILGYIIPFFLVVGALFVLMALTGNEGLSALVSVLLLVPYYLGLYYFRDKLKREFRFRVRESE